MPHEVMIDNIQYIPKASIQKPDDETLRKALHELVSLHYFGQWHKAEGVTSQVVAMLAPELGELMQASVSAAYQRTERPLPKQPTPVSHTNPDEVSEEVLQAEQAYEYLARQYGRVLYQAGFSESVEAGERHALEWFDPAKRPVDSDEE